MRRWRRRILWMMVLALIWQWGLFIKNMGRVNLEASEATLEEGEVVEGGDENLSIPVEPNEWVEAFSRIEPEEALFLEGYLPLRLEEENPLYQEGVKAWREGDYDTAMGKLLKARREGSENFLLYSGEEPELVPDREASEATNTALEPSRQVESEFLEEDMARITLSLGFLSLDRGRFSLAQEEFENALSIFVRIFGEKSLEAQAARVGQCLFYYHTGDLEGFWAKEEEIYSLCDSQNDWLILTAMDELQARMLLTQNDFMKALGLYEQVLERFSVVVKEGELKALEDYEENAFVTQDLARGITNVLRWVRVTYYHMSCLHLQGGNWKEAVKMAELGRKVSSNLAGEGDNTLVTSKLFLALARAQDGMGKKRKSSDSLQRCLEIQEGLSGEGKTYPGLVEIYEVQGEMEKAHGQEDKSEQFFERALELSLKVYGEEHPKTAKAYDYLGQSLCERLPMVSIENLKRALEIRKNLSAENHPETALIYDHLEQVYRLTGETQAAQEARDQADRIYSAWSM